MSDSEFEVLSTGQMRRKYGLTTENRPTIQLNPARVPEPLRLLIPLAERFGVGDDLIRLDICKKTTPEELAAMYSTVAAHEDALEDWLAGPDANNAELTAEYVAFTCLQMAADGC